MKKSDVPTEYIIIKAGTKSEWDSCDFAIVKIDYQWAEITKKRLALLEPFKDSTDFYSHVYWDAPLGYFIWDEGVLDDIFDSTESWSFVLLEEDELQKFSQPESRLDVHMQFINIAGSSHFMCYGKHTGEEYSTECIELHQLV